MRYKVIYSSTTLVDLYIQLPDFPQFADVTVVTQVDISGDSVFNCDLSQRQTPVAAERSPIYVECGRCPNFHCQS